MVIGTAGHIDHGKSALVKALTGYDPDRLKEEKERGMTTDLGFAFYGDKATIIDVPGHEKFIRHMVAGAYTIDLLLLVIAANEGIKPQTVEHLNIAKLLGIKEGIVVLTKKDLVSEEELKNLEKEVRDFLFQEDYLSSAPIISFSAVTNEGLEDLKRLIDEKLEKITPRKKERGIFFMPIDRVFTIKGFGTIVAGTILSGGINIGDNLELLPQKIIVRVRGIERHKKQVTTAKIGERAALNLLGVEKEIIERGNVLATPNILEPTLTLIGFLKILKDSPVSLKKRSSVKFHIGTKETMAKVNLILKEELKPQEEGFAIFHVEEPIVANPYDPFIIRNFSLNITVGGGYLLLNHNPFQKFDEQSIAILEKLKSEEESERLLGFITLQAQKGIKIKDLQLFTGIDKEKIKRIIEELIKEKKIIEIKDSYYPLEKYEDLKNNILKIIETHHQNCPYRKGIKESELKNRLVYDEDLITKALWDLLIEKKIKKEGNFLSLFSFQIRLNEKEENYLKMIEKEFLKREYTPPDFLEIKNLLKIDEKILKKLFTILLENEILIKVDDIYFHQQTIEKAYEILKGNFLKKPITVSEFRQILKTTRKYALPLLHYFDNKGITERKGDIRYLKL
uniref:Selenocysteine-specific elongation factor n=1 Tax=candidate division WOR-3 bacterium TaxID=2052148 RepID=A0A7V3ZUF1_UNCW3